MWFLVKPDPEAMRRQQACQSWGITDAKVLAKCRQSREQASAATEPFKRLAVGREIAWFNQDLSALIPGKTHANDTDYPTQSLEEVEKVTGGVLGFIISQKDGAMFPGKGQLVRLFGEIVTHKPDPDDSPDERTSEPQYFALETEMHPPSTAAGDQAFKKFVERARVNLDIESLNRYERQFIIDHCREFWATPCRAVVLGRIDEIVGRRSAALNYVGVVADQVDIEPLNWNTANPDWLLSARSLEKSKGRLTTKP